MTPDPIYVLIGGNREDRAAAVRELLAGASFVEDHSPPQWPFRRQVTPAPETRGAAGVIWIRDLHLAFPSGQSAGTRLVLTQSTYQMQRWLDWLDRAPGIRVVADALGSALAHSTPEAIAGRGPWSRIRIREVHSQAPSNETVPDSPLHAAFRRPDAEGRVDACHAALAAAPADPALQLALASAWMELDRLDDARRLLERAVADAPDWEAAHFEAGKLWLRADEGERAAAAFADATRLMPTFAAAWGNLGAALGELGRGTEALAALGRARDLDPRGHTILNNIGAAHREMGQLDEAEREFRAVIALAPGFVFGYYNLAHTLLLKGEFQAARAAYEEGFDRDPRKNERQAVRLAVARVAAGDADAAVAMIEELRDALPPERRSELFDEAESTLDALSALPGMDAAGIGRVRTALGRYSS